MTRRSVRTYSKKAVSARDLKLVTDCARRAPSGMNAQAVRITVAQGAPRLKKLLKAVRETLLEGDNAYFKSLAEKPDFNFFYNAPVFVIVSARKKNGPSVAPEADSACAIENMMLAAHSLGLASCWIHMLVGTCDAPKVRRALSDMGVPSTHAVYGSLALGYNSGELPDAPALKGNRVCMAK